MMNDEMSRRNALKLVAAGAASTLGVRGAESKGEARDAWGRSHDRVWLGGGFWANPMEDWKVVDGAAECQSNGPGRNIQSITHQLKNVSGDFTMSVQVERVALKGEDPGAGFRVGVRSELNEHRSNCFAKNGFNVGVVNGEMVIGKKSKALAAGVDPGRLILNLSGKASGDQMELTLEIRSPKSPEVLGSLKQSVSAGSLLGNVALANGFAASGKKGVASRNSNGSSRYRFSNWNMAGTAFEVTPSQRFGPILWSMYSLSDSRSEEGFVMKMSALTGPMGEKDCQVVELQVEREGKWTSLGEARLDPDAWVATFRIPNWDEKKTTPYKLVYREKHRDGSETPDEWKGEIQENPVGRPLRMAALTCQNDYGFPYEPVSRNVEKLKADLVFFSGDQIYESHGGFGIIREPAGPAILNYLRKYYQFGWSFRNVMHSQPTLCLPDDHDVFHGNFWGEGGAKMNVRGDHGASTRGGYREPARMINAVHRTTVAHHPDPDDATPVLQDISVYYGEMVYGNVGFAILSDRQWKSGPEHVDTGGGRADHIPDQDFDTSVLDKEGLVLLGERQEAFLKRWSVDWRGHELKAVLSQTVFAGVATHHGGRNGYLKGDLDSGGWPQTARNRAIDLMRPSMALHINGDQHLTTLCQYGIMEQRDGNWSFCTPAISAGYPRWWLPDEIGMPHQNRPAHGLANTGEFLDGFGNKVYVYAVGNPVVGKAPNRYDKAHEKGSGFGFVTFDTVKKTYALDSYRFLVDVADGKPGNQFPGFPVTIHQKENRGENRIR
ncbi:alkaline phosphatase D family protein [Verrucomicrobiaceae bacterium 227]